jgi:hypothetical protein
MLAFCQELIVSVSTGFKLFSFKTKFIFNPIPSGRCKYELGYSYVRDQCIKAYAKMTYAQAEVTCNQDGAHIYFFKSHDEDPLVFTDVMAAHGNSKWR